MKKVLIILFLIMVIVTFFQIINLYALYKNELSGNYQNVIGKWAIRVSGDGRQSYTTITDNDPNATINAMVRYSNVEEDPNANNVASGKIAPGRQAAINLIIEPQDNNYVKTDVSFEYEISLEDVIVEGLNGEQISIGILGENAVDSYYWCAGQTPRYSSYREQNGNIFRDVFLLKEINEGFINTTTIKFKWFDYVSNNEIDTELGSKLDEVITIPVKINVRQYIGG